MVQIMNLIGRRVIAGIGVLFLVVTAVFFFARIGGDPVAMLAGPQATEAQLEAIRESTGLGRPLLEQYWDYLVGFIQGDLGQSLRWNRPALTMVLERMPATLQLTLLALSLATLIAVPIGIASSVRPGSVIDSASRIIAVFGQSMPNFWLGILLILLFSVTLQWLPSGGTGTVWHLVLPTAALSVYSIPIAMRLVRSSMLEVLRMDYIRTARSKGIASWKVTLNHGFRNAAIPVITVMALRFGHVLGGAVVIEEVFAYPGLGRLAIQAALFRDFFVIQAAVAVIAAFMVFLNLIADVLYTVVDPRVRIG